MSANKSGNNDNRKTLFYIAMVLIDSGKNHPWKIKDLGERPWGNRILTQSQRVH